MNPDTASTQEIAIAVTEKKLSLVRRYIVELLIVVLSFAVVFLFQKQDRMNERLIKYYIEDKNKDQESRIHNSSVIETNNVILRDIRLMFREDQHARDEADTMLFQQFKTR
jgi:hypothetical protein